jgi:hypothetical protein
MPLQGGEGLPEPVVAAAVRGGGQAENLQRLVHRGDPLDAIEILCAPSAPDRAPIVVGPRVRFAGFDEHPRVFGVVAQQQRLQVQCVEDAGERLLGVPPPVRRMMPREPGGAGGDDQDTAGAEHLHHRHDRGVRVGGVLQHLAADHHVEGVRAVLGGQVHHVDHPVHPGAGHDVRTQV